MKLKNLASAPTADSLDSATADEGLITEVLSYIEFRDAAKRGVLGKTAQFWLSYMDHIWLVLSLLEAVKRNDFYLYAHCLMLMADLFFSFGGQNYARYLNYFALFIANVETSHPGSTSLLQRGAFSVARSFVPGNRCDVDKTMEETFMRDAKSHNSCSGAGLTGLLTNFNAYQRWVRSMYAKS